MSRAGLVLSISGAVLSAAVLAGCGRAGGNADSDRLVVVAGTSLIAEAVRHVGGDLVEVENIVPPGGCPGHFDLKPGDVRKLAQAECVLVHGWEKALEAHTEDLSDGRVHRVEIDENWMVPEVFARALSTIAEILATVDPDHQSVYLGGAQAAGSSTVALGEELRRKLREFVGNRTVPVFCDKMQRPFVEWLGLEVIADFGRPEELTPEVLRSLVDRGRERGVRLVINNLQSGGEAGLPIASDLGVLSVVLSNFPGAFPGIGTYEQTLEENVRRVMEALKNK